MSTMLPFFAQMANFSKISERLNEETLSILTLKKNKKKTQGIDVSFSSP